MLSLKQITKIYNPKSNNQQLNKETKMLVKIVFRDLVNCNPAPYDAIRDNFLQKVSIITEGQEILAPKNYFKGVTNNGRAILLEAADYQHSGPIVRVYFTGIHFTTAIDQTLIAAIHRI